MRPQAYVTLDALVVECSGTVTGVARWSGNERGWQARVVLGYRTEGRGDTDLAIVSRCLLGTDQAGTARFRVKVPSHGPVTYHGQLFRLLWYVVAQIPAMDEFWPNPGAVVITVVPRGWLQAAAGQGDG
jgi:hypothetical protein